MTLPILCAKPRDQAAEEGLACKSYGAFCCGYRDYVVAKNVTNHLEHKPSQVMEVDWNGTTMELFCEAAGEAATAYLFVACLSTRGAATSRRRWT